MDQGISANCARDLGRGWKVNPCVSIPAGTTFTMADFQGEGVVNHIWMTPTGYWRHVILRVYWDGSDTPSVECPVGDFFCAGLGEYHQISSLPVCVNPGSAFNCYWQMPFRRGFRMTIENIGFEDMRLYYQIDFSLESVPADAMYFHAQFRRTNPVPYKTPHTILDDVAARGTYVGTYMVWSPKSNGWWGEGEIKFYMDGDKEWPTICGTGTEDYFCGSYNFEDPVRHDRYLEFTTPYTGMQVCRGATAGETGPGVQYRSQARFGLYRWHVADPIHFDRSLRVTIDALGWRAGGRYQSLRDDLSSVAFWYQEGVSKTFPALPDRDGLELC